MAAFSTILGAAVIAGGLGYAGYAAGRGGRSAKPPKPQPLPQAPKVEDAAAKAGKTARAKRIAMARSRSIFTSPLGIPGEADIVRKKLTGQ